MFLCDQRHVVTRDISRQSVKLEVLDTSSGDEGHWVQLATSFRPDVCLLCFAIDDPSSTESLEDKVSHTASHKPSRTSCTQSQWKAEFSEACPDVPVALVGCRSDLRFRNPDPAGEKRQRRAVTHDEVGYVPNDSPS